MTRPVPLLAALAMALAGMLAATCSHAEEAAFDIPSHFRAKIAKEKAKQAAGQASDPRGSGGGAGAGAAGEATCGSQSIGNIDTGGAVGSAPREVFVFAPNAINVVSSRGCN